MSNPIRQAIDTNLASLRVSDGDVARIMERIRQDGQPRVRRLKLRYAIVLAILLALLTAGGTAAMLLTPREIVDSEVLPMAEESENGLWLTDSQVRKVLALARSNGIELTVSSQERIDAVLNEYGGYWTESLIRDLMDARYGTGNWPQEEIDWFNQTIAALEASYAMGRERDPIEGELSRPEAIARAKELIHEVYPEAPLDDPEQYYISAEFLDGLSVGYYPGYYWRVDFMRRTVAAPDVDIELSANGQQLYEFRSRDGASVSASSDDIASAFRDVYGGMNKWTQATWREFVGLLKEAEANGVDIYYDDYYFMMRTEYPDIAPEAIPASEANAIALAAVEPSLRGAAVIKSTVYIGDEPNPIWKVTVLEDRYIEGYEDFWNYFVEIDSVTGKVKVIDESAESYGHRYMYVLHSTYGSTIPDVPDRAYPSVTAEKARMSAVAYLQRRYGETRDLNDPALFNVTVEQDIGWQFSRNIEWLVTFDATGFGEVGYWAYVDGFGDVVDAGANYGAINLGRSLDSIRLARAQVLGFTSTDDDFFADFLDEVRTVADQDDPVVRLLLDTQYVAHYDGWWDDLADAQDAVNRALGLKEIIVDSVDRYASVSLFHVNRPELGLQCPVWKLGICSDKGNFLVEVRKDTLDILSVVEVERIVDPWYAPILLQSDMEAAGIAPTPYARPANNGLAVDEGIVRGMRLEHIYNRFCDLYGPSPLSWSQAQLQSFQQAVSQSSSLAEDIGVPCVRATRYPAIPENAISREEAALAGAQALALTDYEVEGAVLIADAPNAVWKVCYRTGDSFRYAEVDCLTGEVKTVAERGEPSYWFQDIVLERVIRENEETFVSTSNG